MAVHSYHLAVVPARTSITALLKPPSGVDVPGLRHAECMTIMRLGAPIVSPSRIQLRRLAVFASWDDEAAIDGFLEHHPVGRRLAAGWHVRLDFLRRWGNVEAFDGLPIETGPTDPDEPVVAVTLARMRLTRLPRFLRWGRPVETLVRDHPGNTLALAGLRMPRTVSTFSIWRTAHEMTEMVLGHSAVDEPERHIAAMRERDRKDFHFEFTTLRFRTLSEHGEWEGRRDLVPVSTSAG